MNLSEVKKEQWNLFLLELAFNEGGEEAYEEQLAKIEKKEKLEKEYNRLKGLDSTWTCPCGYKANKGLIDAIRHQQTCLSGKVIT